MAKTPKTQDKDDLAKLEPKLTIIKKRNPAVFEWVKSLSRGKLTQFIYEVLDTYMENGFLLEDSWIHPTDEKAMKLLNHQTNIGANNQNSEEIKQRLDEINRQVSLILAAVQSQGGLSNSLPSLLAALMAQNQPNMMGFTGNPNYQNPNSFNNQTGFNNQISNQNEQVSHQLSTQMAEQSLSLETINNGENKASDDLVFTLEETDTANSHANITAEKEPLQSIGSSGGFSIF